MDRLDTIDRQTRPLLRSLIAADIVRYSEQAAGFQAPKPGLLRRISIMLMPSLTCCILIRAAHAAHLRGWYGIGRAIGRLNQLLFRIQVDPAAPIGPGLYVPHPPGVVFRGRAGRNLTLYTHSIVGPAGAVPMHGDSLPFCPVLGDGVVVGAFAILAGPVTVGDDAQLGPGAVVIEQIPERATVMATGAMGRVRSV